MPFIPPLPLPPVVIQPLPDYPTDQAFQGTLSTSSPTVVTAPVGYMCRVLLRFNNPLAYDVTMDLTRVKDTNPPSTLQLYSLTLDAGDTVEDTGCLLYPGDSISMSTTTAGTNYFMTVNCQKYYRTR